MPRRSRRDEPEYEWIGFNATGATWSFEGGDASPVGIISPGDNAYGPDVFNNSIHNIADYTNFVRVIMTAFVNPASATGSQRQIESLIVARHVDNADRAAFPNYWGDPDDLGEDNIIGYTANAATIPAEQSAFDDEPSAKLHMDVASTRVIEDTDVIALEYQNTRDITITVDLIGRVLMRKD